MILSTTLNNSNSTTNDFNNNKRRIFDYFAICGLPPALSSSSSSNEQLPSDEHEKLLLRNNSTINIEHDSPSMPTTPVGGGGGGGKFDMSSNITAHNNKQQHYLFDERLEPIVELGILNKSLNESVPHGFECIWQTPAGHSANLCVDALYNQNEVFLVYRRGKDRPPITDIGIYYEGSSDDLIAGCTVLRKTVGGNSANLNTSSLNAVKIYITFQRARDFPCCNALAAIEICVILKNKVGRVVCCVFFF